MFKYAKITNTETKKVSVGTGANSKFYKSIGMELMQVEKAYNGEWYLLGHAPVKPQEEINAERIAELKNNLTATDYKIIKIAEGSATKEQYAEDIAQRQAWRAEINQLGG